MMHNATPVNTKFVAMMIDTAVRRRTHYLENGGAEVHQRVEPGELLYSLEPHAKVKARKLAGSRWINLIEFHACTSGLTRAPSVSTTISLTLACTNLRHVVVHLADHTCLARHVARHDGVCRVSGGSKSTNWITGMHSPTSTRQPWLME